MKRSNTKLSAVDLTELLRPYTSGWVAVSADQTRVVGSADTLEEVIERAIDHYEVNALYIKVIPPEEGYVSLVA
jgi:hypothetical protein